MMLSETPDAVQLFRDTPWKFQQTFHTPVQDLPNFVATILSAQRPIHAGCLTIDQVAFEPKHLIAALAEYSLPPTFGHDWSIVATGPREVESLLEAALGDWVDLIFVPTAKPFAIYADHDEYTTFYANSESDIRRIAEALLTAGFEMVPEYERRL
jgi:hypothetical protein